MYRRIPWGMQGGGGHVNTPPLPEQSPRNGQRPCPTPNRNGYHMTVMREDLTFPLQLHCNWRNLSLQPLGAVDFWGK